MKWQVDQIDNKIKFHSEMDFKISQSDREILFQQTEFNFISN